MVLSAGVLFDLAEWTRALNQGRFLVFLGDDRNGDRQRSRRGAHLSIFRHLVSPEDADVVKDTAGDNCLPDIFVPAAPKLALQAPLQSICADGMQA
jgi:hypothetical protein